ncbi:zinc-binding alcohol dehydrogenase family protein [Acrocarpospora corrugata]|uniref:zinc-binding alcohol dehydrogenase family protein n=1 Tax=Acrocarpospora corrugata TaxID=35763 RepID=UPI001C3FE9C3|nr:zinc-binding alcohol dehydrogenase family protein [Acrocarpospora corrugata]
MRESGAAMAGTMRVVGFRENLPVGDPSCLIDAEVPIPRATGRDLLVRVKAVSVNPVDVKERMSRPAGGELQILGYDAAGVVEAVGDEAGLFRVGDEVYYAGSIARSGSNAEFQLVDERLVGRKPYILDFAEAAAMPLTAITAWETLHDRFRLTKDSEGTLVVVGAAGGVGSMMLQLARRLCPDLTLIGTASRAKSRVWAEEMGAQHVVDHHGDLAAAVLAVSPEGVDYILSPYSAANLEAYQKMLKPGGQVTAIDDPHGLDISGLKSKSLTWHWEFVFTRPLYAPHDTTHHDLLNVVAELVDGQQARSTLTQRMRPINAATLREAHATLERSGTIGKVVVEGW